MIEFVQDAFLFLGAATGLILLSALWMLIIGIISAEVAGLITEIRSKDENDEGF